MPAHSSVQPHRFIAVRLPSEGIRLFETLPNNTISLGKYGSFSANLILGRPFHTTYEILDKEQDQSHSLLRRIPASEVHGETLNADEVSNNDSDLYAEGADGVEYELVGEDGEVIMRTNRQTVDDSTRQKLTMEEIEELKKRGTGAGKDLISQLLVSHSALHEKTSFSLAKYTLRKTKKFSRRFTVLPLDIPTLTQWLLREKEPQRIFELRCETLSLMGSWANVRFNCSNETRDSGESVKGRGRWLVVDETGGLVVASMAERMGILYADDNTDLHSQDSTQAGLDRPRDHQGYIPAMSASDNTLTLIHPNQQPNLALLRYFHFDSNNPSPQHPLYKNLKLLSWLQLLHPEEDIGYTEPEPASKEDLSAWKSTKRGMYYRKRRRWERIKSVVDETRAGGFDGLVVASVMNASTILHHTVPLLRGAAQVVVYSPTIEPLTELADCYSTPRKTAFINSGADSMPPPSEDYPVHPLLLLAPTVHHTKARRWQCLPGRTHPIMMARGGAEGYVMTATRVIPAEGRIEAMGKHKRRKTVPNPSTNGQTVGSLNLSSSNSVNGVS